MEETISNSPPLQVVIVPNPKYQDGLSLIEEKRKKVPKLLSSTAASRSCSIFRVPQNIKNLHPKAFIPEILSIGPYYHGQQHLQMIQEHKWRILDLVLDRLKPSNVSIDDFYKALAIKEEDIRGCYSENIDEFNSHELIEMMILDGCFTIELLCVAEKIIQPDLEDPIFNVPWIFTSLTRDLLRLENQIPFFVLQILYKLFIPDYMQVPNLQELILELCNYSFSGRGEVSELRKKYENNNGEHLLDFYRSTFKPAKEEEKMDGADLFRLIQPVEKLREAGIEFEERVNKDSFLDINFSENGVLEIPRLVMDDSIGCFLLNCIAFEQCYKHTSMYFTTYIVFMGCLINTPLDAGHLRDNRIIENFFGTDKEVVKFFNEVGKDINFDFKNTYLEKVFKDVDDYYRNVWYVRWAEFKHNYFGSPWIFISAFVAFVLLLLTILSTFFSVYAYFQPPS